MLPDIVLASQSPRRRELLNAAGIAHKVRAAAIDESPLSGETPLDYVRRMAREKAMAVHCGDNELVLAADTTVICDAQIFGKPLDRADARRMLLALSGKRHEVTTGICFRFADQVKVRHEVTRVRFSELTPEDIEEYLATDEPMDKAGGYAIQGIASRYVELVEGSYSNVVGLPVALVWRELEKLRNSLF